MVRLPGQAAVAGEEANECLLLLGREHLVANRDRRLSVGTICVLEPPLRPRELLLRGMGQERTREMTRESAARNMTPERALSVRGLSVQSEESVMILEAEVRPLTADDMPWMVEMMASWSSLIRDVLAGVHGSHLRMHARCTVHIWSPA